MKANIRNQAKIKLRQIIKEQQEELEERKVEQGSKEYKEDFLQKIANASGI